MKLSELRAAIRKTKGNPSIVVALVPGAPMTLMLQKTPLLDELGRVYGNERTADTGLTFDENTGILGGVYKITSNDGAGLAPPSNSEEDDDIL